MTDKAGRVSDEIQELIDRETQAWDHKDAEALVALFHPDMVWPWPKDNQSHDPLTWDFSQGRFNRKRWLESWNRLFDEYDLIHNRRETRDIKLSQELDGAFAVVDVDTLWKHKKNGELLHWKGRAGKGYSKIGDNWKLVCHTGLLLYEKGFK